MAQYRVLVRSFINNAIIDPETMPAEQCIVEYDGKPGSNLELIEPSKKRAEKPKEEE